VVNDRLKRFRTYLEPLRRGGHPQSRLRAALGSACRDDQISGPGPAGGLERSQASAHIIVEGHSRYGQDGTQLFRRSGGAVDSSRHQAVTRVEPRHDLQKAERRCAGGAGPCLSLAEAPCRRTTRPPVLKGQILLSEVGCRRRTDTSWKARRAGD